MNARKGVFFVAMVFLATGLLFGGNPLCLGAAPQETWKAQAVDGVSLQRDDRGVWFIEGPDTVPAFAVYKALGYAVATDRLWQGEVYRRSARGRLAEIFGPEQLLSDMLVRTMGYSDEELDQGFAALNPEVKEIVAGYLAGFNQRIQEVRKDDALLPYEYKTVAQNLGKPFLPEFWTHRDLLAWVSLLLRNFDPEGFPLANMEQIKNAALYQDFLAAHPQEADKMFSDLRWLDDPDALTYIKENGERLGSHGPMPGETLAHLQRLPSLGQAGQDMAGLWGRIEAGLEKINARVKMGSYAWVVHGSKTADGHPILYSGPQMGFSVPSIVLEGSIRAGGFEISGMTVVGLPGIVIGRTPHHAWSMQVGHAHTTDYFLESPSAITLHRVELIKIAGGGILPLPVYRSSHGPVVYPFPYLPIMGRFTTPLSWKYAHWGHEFQTIEAFLMLGRATSMDEFGAGIEKIGVSQHFCYADRDGNIAYWMSGRDPVRAEGADPRFPQLGDGSQEWPEPVTLKPRSTERNPASGYFSGWNNRTAPGYPNATNSLWLMYGPFHRAHVIDASLKTREDLTYEDVRDLALDIATTDSFGYGGNPWAFVAAPFSAMVVANPTPERLAALDLLDAWDGHFVAGGPGNWASGTLRADAWVLMNAWVDEVLRLTFEDELGDSQPKDVLFNCLLHGIPDLGSVLQNQVDWFVNASDPNAPQTLEAVVLEALDNVLVALGPTPWDVERGEIVYEHTFLGEVHRTPFSSRSTYAHCVAYGAGGPLRIESMFPLGESGTILMDAQGAPLFDPHFLSMAPDYDAFTPRAFPLFD